VSVGEADGDRPAAPARTLLDALHIGSALVVGPYLFVSADRRETAAAEAEGLRMRRCKM